jgi:hypothetical protein
MAEYKCKYNVRTGGGRPPELRLLLAILEDAIHCYRKNLFATNRQRRRLFQEAEVWLMSDEGVELPFSFEHVCVVVGLNPSYVRGVIRKWRDRQLASTSKLQSSSPSPHTGTEAPAARSKSPVFLQAPAGEGQVSCRDRKELVCTS